MSHHAEPLSHRRAQAQRTCTVTGVASRGRSVLPRSRCEAARYAACAAEQLLERRSLSEASTCGDVDQRLDPRLCIQVRRVRPHCYTAAVSASAGPSCCPGTKGSTCRSTCGSPRALRSSMGSAARMDVLQVDQCVTCDVMSDAICPVKGEPHSVGWVYHNGPGGAAVHGMCTMCLTVWRSYSQAPALPQSSF